MIVMDAQFDADEDFDVVIGVCGTERRSTYLARIGVKAKVSIAVDYPGEHSYANNRAIYEANGWKLMSRRSALRVAEDSLQGIRSAAMLIDISSMSRTTLAAVVEWLATSCPASVRVKFAYCPAEFLSSANAARAGAMIQAKPVLPFFAGRTRPSSLPIGLVCGLGLEPDRAVAIIELLEPQHTWAFFPVGGDARFEEEAVTLVSSLSGAGQVDTFLEYPVHSFQATFRRLESLLFAIGTQYRTVLAPSGPKMFSLICLLIGAARQDTRPAVWRVGGPVLRNPLDVTESGEVVAGELQRLDAW